jgi:hypothetical protein
LAFLVDCAPAYSASDDSKPANWAELRLPAPPGGIKAETQARRMLQDAGQIADKPLFEAYWRHFFSQITWYEMRDRLADGIRIDLKKQLKGRRGPAQQYLVREIALPMMRDIAGDAKYHPLVRYNALLLLGDLNDKEPDRAGQGATSLPEALPILLEYLDATRPVNDTNDALRVAALIGVKTHLERGGISDPQLREKCVKAVTALAAEKTPPPGRDPDVHAWIARAAQDVIGAMQPAAPVTAAVPRTR